MEIVIYTTCPNTGKSFEYENPIFYIEDDKIKVDVECPYCHVTHIYEI